jgi:GntR family transcriptional repressor for pyruvate dehydrogenase complex
MPNETPQIIPVQRKDVTSSVIDNILKMIADGYWGPGEQLPSQRKLARLMDVSMASLREALYSLQAMGILEMRQGAGTYVSDFSDGPGEKIIELSMLLGTIDIKMFFEAREVIEPGLASLAAEYASEEQIITLFQILDEQKKAFELGNEEYLHDLDLDFHQHLAEMANNQFLLQLNDILFKNLDKLFRVLPLSRGGWTLHKKVADAIRDRLPMEAYNSMKVLIQRSYKNYQPFIDKQPTAE